MGKEIFVVAQREYYLLRATPRSMFESVFYPILYMLIFAPAIGSQVGPIDVGMTEVPYMLFALPGILIFNGFSASQYGGISLYIHKLLGDFEMVLSFPLRRSSIVWGKIIPIVIKSMIQTLVFIFLCVLFFGWNAFSLTTLLILLFTSTLFTLLGAMIFLSISASIERQDTFNIMVNMITLPIMFTSNALYSLEKAPYILQIISKINPLTYFISAMRETMFLQHYESIFILWILGLVLLFPLIKVTGHRLQKAIR
ncbi:MAG: ABC transporter permease [Tissierellia bacterium]|nr:ABC transporter permease [Tissierellia bacterium]